MTSFLAEIRRDWPGLFPQLPPQPEVSRRTRWLWGAFEQLRATLAARLPEDDCQQIDTSALPVRHTSRVRGANQQPGPGNDLAARFGRDAAHAEWFYGFRLAIKADLGSRVIRAWSIVPGAVNEREIAVDLLETGPAPHDLLADKGFNGKAFAAQLAARGIAVLVPPSKDQRQQMPGILQKVIARWRNRIETSFGEITDRMELAVRQNGADPPQSHSPGMATTTGRHPLRGPSRHQAGGLPRLFWVLWAGILINRLGTLVEPFLGVYLVVVRGFPVVAAGGMLAVYALSSVFSRITGGLLADRLGRRAALILGMLANGASLIALGYVTAAAGPGQLALAPAIRNRTEPSDMKLPDPVAQRTHSSR